MASLTTTQPTYLPDSGEIVNVIQDVTGTSTTGKPYTIKAGGFFSPKVVQITTASIGKNYMSIDDGTANSPIKIAYNRYAFEAANVLERNLFTPYHKLGEDIIGKFIHSASAVKIYTSIGGSLRRTAAPNSYIGKVESLDSSNWITVNNGLGYLPKTSDLTFVAPDPNAAPLSKEQEQEVVLNSLKAMPNGEVVSVAETVGTAAKDVIDIAGFFLKNIKWFIIGAIIIAIIIAAVYAKSLIPKAK